MLLNLIGQDAALRESLNVAVSLSERREQVRVLTPI
jgi:hypothetical protein